MSAWTVFSQGWAVDASAPSFNKFSVLFLDDEAVDTTNVVFKNIGLQVDQSNAIHGKKHEKKASGKFEKRSERVDIPELRIEIKTVDTGERLTVTGLLDSGTTTCFIDEEFVKQNRLNSVPLPIQVPIYNVDGSKNAKGTIKVTVDLIITVQGHTERTRFSVCGLGKIPLILGETWLKTHNPEINWETGHIKFSWCPRCCRQYSRRVKIEEVEETSTMEEDEERILCVMIGKPEKDAAIRNICQNLAIEAEKKKLKRSFEDIVPKAYHHFCSVFAKESFDELPPKRTWDHAIELKPGSQPHAGKIYNLTLDEQKQLEIFFNKNLKSGRIRPSKSPMAAPFFFIKKKSGELHPVQEYHHLNAMMIKNTYPLPLILELIDKLKGAKYFMKLNVRWGYNNVRIKEGNKWKAAFITNKELFEPLVMFFGLTNSPTTFQTMMNHLFRGLIAKGHIVIYMDNILIFMATIEEHRQIVQEVLQILAENKLYLKPEKCDFEKLEIEYLGLRIAYDKIMMDPIKVEGVADWPVPRNVTDVRSFLGFT